jgi:hypothetical protein
MTQETKLERFADDAFCIRRIPITETPKQEVKASASESYSSKDHSDTKYGRITV